MEGVDRFHEILKQYWGYDHFRPLQEDIINSISAGKDTLGLMPTGGGKSLTFQVPVMGMEGICIVVTPLIALMKDQVDNLRNRKIKALAVYSGMTYQEILIALDNAIYGDFKFLYISPERLGSQLFLQKLQHLNVCMMVVDEAHCISQWGYDFRPSYLRISKMREYIQRVPILALTATATPEVVDDIQRQLNFSQKNVFQTSFERTNLAYIIRTTENKWEELIHVLTKINGSALVYVRSRNQTKEISDFLCKSAISSDFYHAGLPAKDKERKQSLWKDNLLRVIVCTNAFGMGIDKADVRVVIHMDLPNSIEEYFQEAGRAGRDGNKSYAIILYNKTDSTKLKKRITNEFPNREFILDIYNYLAYFFQVADGYGMGAIYDFNMFQFCKTYKIPILPTHNALKILELSGYIEYQDEVNNRSRLMVLAYRNELYSLDISTDSSEVLNAVLRLYTGLFANYVVIDEEEIGQRLQMSRREVYDLLIYLSKRRIVDYIPHKRTPLIVYTQPRQDIKYLTIPKLVYEDRLSKFQCRVGAMCDYVEQTTKCRSLFLLNYFGETLNKDCGQCDICLAKNESGLSNWRFNKIEFAITQLLRNNDQTMKTVFDMLAEYKSEDIKAALHFMVEKGAIKVNLDTLSLINSNSQTDTIS